MTAEGTSDSQAPREARQHHLVPSSFLALFADDLSKDGRIHVASPSLKKRWASTPSKSARERDFYRVEKEGLDPQVAERALGKLESEATPLLKKIAQSAELPNSHDFELVLLYFASLEARGRSVRGFVDDMMRRLGTITMQLTLTNPSLWAQSKEKIVAEGFPVEKVPEPAQLLDALRTGRVKVRAAQNGLITSIGQALSVIFPLLQQRNWQVVVPQDRIEMEFITSDRPVVLANTGAEPPPFYSIGLGMAGTDVSVAIGPHVVLLGTYEPSTGAPSPCSAEYIAMMNSRTFNRSVREVYSHAETFFVLGQNNALLSVDQLFSGPGGASSSRDAT